MENGGLRTRIENLECQHQRLDHKVGRTTKDANIETSIDGMILLGGDEVNTDET